jgi:hypothetical protein
LGDHYWFRPLILPTIIGWTLLIWKGEETCDLFFAALAVCFAVMNKWVDV